MGLKLSKKGPKLPRYSRLSLVECLQRNYIRSLVSKQRRRMLVAGYDLDMTYITGRLLAMSFPSESVRALYRNPMWQVESALEMRHHDHYKAGKGRTGLMVSCYLVYTGMSSERALHLFAERRTTNNKGVPGKRYAPPAEVSNSCCRRIEKNHEKSSNKPLYYFSLVEKEEDKEEAVETRLVIQMDTESSIIYQKKCLGFDYEKPLQVKGDVRLIFYEKLTGGRLFYVCFNTTFITGSLLQFSVRDLDKVGKRGRSICGPSFCLELFFAPSYADCLVSPSKGDVLCRI
ncbi:Calcium/lipid-binding (CaLB) phosphatase [Striga hermonthica]|uniref:Calcium/lipid-binding (CaLB) phosphatase n=1 Tax=Striga hermonthica TaxID=68872 RepID=A0A9N7NGG5_STRHE|nr:Calcium/lipid-binding (CaLB) phosphatase [Striga hermonthica]